MTVKWKLDGEREEQRRSGGESRRRAVWQAGSQNPQPSNSREEGGKSFRSELADHFAGIISRVEFSSKLLQSEVMWFNGVKVLRCPL